MARKQRASREEVRSNVEQLILISKKLSCTNLNILCKVARLDTKVYLTYLRNIRNGHTCYGVNEEIKEAVKNFSCLGVVYDKDALRHIRMYKRTGDLDYVCRVFKMYANTNVAYDMTVCLLRNYVPRDMCNYFIAMYDTAEFKEYLDMYVTFGEFNNDIFTLKYGNTSTVGVRCLSDEADQFITDLLYVREKPMITILKDKDATKHIFAPALSMYWKWSPNSILTECIRGYMKNHPDYKLDEQTAYELRQANIQLTQDANEYKCVSTLRYQSVCWTHKINRYLGAMIQGLEDYKDECTGVWRVTKKKTSITKKI